MGMTISLSPQVKKYVEEQVRVGRFASPEEVVEAGLARLMLDPPPDELDEEDVRAIEEAEVVGQFDSSARPRWYHAWADEHSP